MRKIEWSECTFLAWEQQKGICPICKGKIYLFGKGDVSLVGHHRINRCEGGLDEPSNAIARHTCCERLAHRIDRRGNPTEAQLKCNESYADAA